MRHRSELAAVNKNNDNQIEEEEPSEEGNKLETLSEYLKNTEKSTRLSGRQILFT